MERRQVVFISAVVLVCGVLVLRGAGEDSPSKQPSKPPPTAVSAFAAEGIVLPRVGNRPGKPSNLRVTPGHHRLKVLWDGDAPGYEVRWGQHVRFVTRPAIQLDGLEQDQEQQVEVRAVDAFGQRSQPVTGAGTPRVDNAEYSFVDRFDGLNTPDATRWRFAKRTDCARATPGDGDDHKRLVISSNCATNIVSLRSRTPFVRGATESRFVVETDAPNSGGQLLLDLVPGPVGIQAGVEPPESIRLAVTTDAVGNSIVELFPKGTSQSLPQAAPGVSARWELVLTPAGVRAERDGVAVASSPYVPPWQEATALVGIAALAGDRTRVGVDLVGFRGAPVTTPPLVPTPDVDLVVTNTAPPPSAPLDGVTGGQLRLALVPAEAEDPNMRLLIGSAEVPLRPAVPGSAWQPGVEIAMVADLPASLVGQRVNAALRSATRVQVTHTDLELTGSLRGTPTAEVTEPLSGQRTKLARPRVDVLDAGGEFIPPGEAAPRGRLVLEVRMDSLATAVSGLAGFDVRLDDTRVATVSTTVDGPGVAGRWRISLNTATLSQSPHTVEIRAFSTDSETATESTYVSFLLKP